MRRLPLSALCLTLVLAACGSSDPKVLADEGHKALGAGDAALALEKFDAALKRIEPASPDFVRVQIGRFQALARREPAKAKTEFLAFQAAHSDKVRDSDFRVVVDELARKGSISEATDLVEAAKKLYPESPVVAQLVKSVGDAALRSKDPAMLDKMRGLGYGGGSADEEEPVPATPPAKKPE